MTYTIQRGDKQINFTLEELKEAVSDGWVSYYEYVTMSMGEEQVKELKVRDIL